MQKDLHRLIAQIYTCASKQEWLRTLEDIEAYFRVRCCTVGHFNSSRTAPNSLQITSCFSSISCFHQPFYSKVQNAPRLLVTEDLTVTPVNEYARLHHSRLFDAGIKSVDVERIIWTALLRQEKSVVFLAFKRERVSPAFNEEHVKILKVLAMHFITAFEIFYQGKKTAIKHATFESICETHENAIAVITMEGQLVFSNSQAEEVFSRSPLLSIKNGFIFSSFQEVDQKLRLAFQKVISQKRKTAPYIVTLPGTICSPAMEVKIALFMFEDGFKTKKETRLILTIQLSEGSFACASNVFSLTKKELLVADLLMQGHSLQEIAHILFRSRETIKSHVKQLMRKTQTHSQLKLVSALQVQ